MNRKGAHSVFSLTGGSTPRININKGAWFCGWPTQKNIVFLKLGLAMEAAKFYNYFRRDWAIAKW